MQNPFVFILAVVCLVLLTRSLTVLIHELGHGLTALLLTRSDVKIYIGSYGNPKKSIRIKLGKLTIFFRYNPFAWRLGLFVPSEKPVSINKQIIFTLAGPLASLLIGTISGYFAFDEDVNGFFKLCAILFLGSAIFDFWINVVPSDQSVKLYDGRIVYNDGHRLKQLFSYKRLPPEYSQAVNLYHEQRFADAANLCEQMLEHTSDENVYRLAISSYLQDGNYMKGKELSDSFLLLGKMDSDDFTRMAAAYSQLTHYNEALEFYDQSLALNPDNKYSLNNKGYTLNLMTRFEEAIAYFDRAIKVDKEFAHTYNNRGLAKIKLGMSEEGLEDINQSIQIDATNAYCYRNLGIYHFDKGEFVEALQLFTKARELDAKTHMIDELINETQSKID